LVTAACSDNQLSPDRATAPGIGPTPQFQLVEPPAVCPSVDSSQKTVDTLLPQIFGPGQGRRGKAQGYNNNVVQARRNGNNTLEETYVDSLINFTLENYYNGNLIGGDSEATQNRVLSFFYAMYCASEIEPIPDLSYIFTTENTRLIRYNTPTTTVSADSAAVEIEQGEVPDTIFGTWVSVLRSDLPLPTSLDWYGIDGYRAGAWEFVANPPVEFTDPVLVGVCIEFDDAIVSATDLRLAHAVEAGYVATGGNSVVTTGGGTIEIAAYADPDPLGLACDPLPEPTASRGVVGRLLHQFASLFVPQRLYAITSGGSTGGTVRKFSPFGAVDIKLNTDSTGPSSPQYIPIGSSTITAPVTVTLTTRNDATAIDGIPVTFAPAAKFSPTAGTTDGSGTAGSTWTLAAGANSGTATPAKAPLSFVPATINFSVTAVQLTALNITSTSPLPGGQKTVAYGPVTLTASGGAGAGTYGWGLAPGSAALPAGLALSSSGVLSGTPTVTGSFSFTVRVTSGPLTADKEFSIAIAVPPVSITTASPLTAGTVGLPYSQALAASGGDGTYSWTVTAGTPPTDLGLSTGGVLAGTPSAAATSSFTVQVSSAGGTVTASKTFSLTVAYPGALGSLAFQPAPSGSACYALNVIMTPSVGVKVTSTSGLPVVGVRVDLVAVTNNGSKVAVSQPFAITGIDGVARFTTLSINKTGAYRLVASTAAPWPVKSVQSGKFNISPSC
jgi:hypothetical protein